jgi:hypothetical protein
MDIFLGLLDNFLALDIMFQGIIVVVALLIIWSIIKFTIKAIITLILLVGAYYFLSSMLGVDTSTLDNNIRDTKEQSEVLNKISEF